MSRVALSKTLRKATALAAVVLIGGATLPAAPSDQPSEQTIKNLQAALNGERNAHARYLAFAQKADEEHYGEVASLFRAAAASEEIHGNNHEAVLQKAGITPEVKLEAPDVQSTAENLQAAIKGENYEWQTMYPEFLTQAQQERYVPATVTFQEALGTEQEHARLYAHALKNLDQLKGSSARTYYVCGVCGFTTDELNFERCPNCLQPKERYSPVS